MKRQYFYLVRHGDKVRELGDVPLTPHGVIEAKKTGAFLAQLPITSIWASPLLRTQQTAREIAAAFPTPQEVQTSPLLRERANWGDDPEQTFEEFVTMWFQATKERDWQPSVGDSSRTAGNRVETLLAQLVELPDSHIALVSHGGTIMDFLRNCFSPDELAKHHPEVLEKFEEIIPTCSITQLSRDRETGTWKLESLATTDHLV